MMEDQLHPKEEKKAITQEIMADPERVKILQGILDFVVGS